MGSALADSTVAAVASGAVCGASAAEAVDTSESTGFSTSGAVTISGFFERVRFAMVSSLLNSLKNLGRL